MNSMMDVNLTADVAGRSKIETFTERAMTEFNTGDLGSKPSCIGRPLLVKLRSAYPPGKSKKTGKDLPFISATLELPLDLTPLLDESHGGPSIAVVNPKGGVKKPFLLTGNSPYVFPSEKWVGGVRFTAIPYAHKDKGALPVTRQLLHHLKPGQALNVQISARMAAPFVLHEKAGSFFLVYGLTLRAEPFQDEDHLEGTMIRVKEGKSPKDTVFDYNPRFMVGGICAFTFEGCAAGVVCAADAFAATSIRADRSLLPLIPPSAEIVDYVANGVGAKSNDFVMGPALGELLRQRWKLKGSVVSQRYLHFDDDGDRTVIDFSSRKSKDDYVIMAFSRPYEIRSVDPETGTVRARMVVLKMWSDAMCDLLGLRNDAGYFAVYNATVGLLVDHILLYGSGLIDVRGTLLGASTTTQVASKVVFDDVDDIDIIEARNNAGLDFDFFDVDDESVMDEGTPMEDAPDAPSLSEDAVSAEDVKAEPMEDVVVPLQRRVPSGNKSVYGDAIVSMREAMQGWDAQVDSYSTIDDIPMDEKDLNNAKYATTLTLTLYSAQGKIVPALQYIGIPVSRSTFKSLMDEQAKMITPQGDRDLAKDSKHTPFDTAVFERREGVTCATTCPQAAKESLGHRGKHSTMYVILPGAATEDFVTAIREFLSSAEEHHDKVLEEWKNADPATRGDAMDIRLGGDSLLSLMRMTNKDRTLKLKTMGDISSKFSDVIVSSIGTGILSAAKVLLYMVATERRTDDGVSIMQKQWDTAARGCVRMLRKPKEIHLLAWQVEAMEKGVIETYPPGMLNNLDLPTEELLEKIRTDNALMVARVSARLAKKDLNAHNAPEDEGDDARVPTGLKRKAEDEGGEPKRTVT